MHALRHTDVPAGFEKTHGSGPQAYPQILLPLVDVTVIKRLLCMFPKLILHELVILITSCNQILLKLKRKMCYFYGNWNEYFGKV